MIVAGHMQSSVHHESRELLANANAILVRRFARNVRRDVDVADQSRGLPRLAVTEGDDVRVDVAFEMPDVEHANGTPAHERDGNEGVRDALSAQDTLRYVANALTAEGYANAFKGDAHKYAQVLASSDS